MHRHSLLLFDSKPGKKALESISVSHTIKNVISLGLKCSSVGFPFFKQNIFYLFVLSSLKMCTAIDSCYDLKVSFKSISYNYCCSLIVSSKLQS